MVEFKNQDDLEVWLNAQPHHTSVVMITRAALRVLPQLHEFFGNEFDKKSSTLALSIFRCLFITHTIVSLPNRVKELEFTAMFSAQAHAWTGIETLLDAYESDRRVLNSISYPIRLSGMAAAHVVEMQSKLFDIDLFPDGDFRSAWETDVEFLSFGNSVQALLECPLWSMDVVAPIQLEIHVFREVLHAISADWHVWTSWYQDRLDGKQLNLQLAENLGFDLLKNRNENPSEISTQIRRLMKKYGDWQGRPYPPIDHDLAMEHAENARLDVVNAQEFAVREIEKSINKLSTQSEEVDRLGIGGNKPPDSGRLDPEFDRDQAAKEAAELLAEEGEARWIRAMTDVSNIIKQDRLEILGFDEYDEYDESIWDKVAAQKERLKWVAIAIGTGVTFEIGRSIAVSLKVLLSALARYLGFL